jgi:UDPglucose 6-dehydrogenase
MKLSVHGLGHLGFPLACVLASAGYDTCGFDINSGQVERLALNKHWSYEHLSFETMPPPCDASFVVVPTPSIEDGSFDDVYVHNALSKIGRVNPKNHIAVVVSTVSPGTMQLLAKQHPRLTLIYNPTFIALDHVIEGLTRPDMLLLGGENKVALNKIELIWATVFAKKTNIGNQPLIHQGSWVEIELLKLSVNAALGTKINLANSLGKLFQGYGVDPAAVQIVGEDHRIGREFFRPGPPITGPCLPRDNAALQAAAERIALTLPISEATDEVNAILYTDILAAVLYSRPKSVGILGLGYKYAMDVDTAAVGPFLRNMLVNAEIPVKTFDEILDSDDFDDVMKCDVIVATHPEYGVAYDLTPRRKSQRVINLWS